MSKLEEQKALPRRKLFKPAGTKLARMAAEGRIGRAHLGLNPMPKRKAKKAKGKR